MKNLVEYLEESFVDANQQVNVEPNEESIEESNEDFVYAVVDKDLGGAIMSTWDLEQDAETEKAEREKENNDIKLDIKKLRRSEIEADTTKQ